MKLIIASNNKGKIKEIKEIFGDKFEEIISQKEAGCNIEVVEDGTTFFENAFKKAREISELTGYAALSDDSGLAVDALNGAPGIYSARYGGENTDDEKNIDKLLSEMKDEPKRSARFISCVVIYFPGGRFLTAEGAVEGEILYERKGEGGFGYDPVFYSYDLNKSFGEASFEEKNAVSHRGKALRALYMKLKEVSNGRL